VKRRSFPSDFFTLCSLFTIPTPVAAFLHLRGKRTAMNVKRIFGIILTVLGIFGLIYAATLFINAKGTNNQIKMLIVYGVLGAIFFFTGIGLVKTTHDDRRPPVG
jgi:ABC-type transporter lipoprotein component MlaA